MLSTLSSCLSLKTNFIPNYDIFGVSLQAPKSRHNILQINDGNVMAPGTLADLETFNYDILVKEYIDADTVAGVENSKYFTLNFVDREKTLK